ncbi:MULTISPECIES: DNA repair protein RecO [Aphanothece]|uniref:DNA repair protein RecO n=1 Tax=Aphanothece TaxID=1121 RepID=UPI003984A59E
MPETSLEGLALSSRPLGESDRLLTLLSEQAGLVRLAVPGARKPRSSLAAAVPLAHLRLQVGGRGDLLRVRQLKVLRNYSGLAGRLDALAAAQALAELCLALVPSQSPAPGMLADVLMQLGRLEEVVRDKGESLEVLALAVQGSVHLLALGGYALPLGQCCRSGERLDPPLGNWTWRCSVLPSEGIAIGAVPGARVVLNASELALLQRLVRPSLPRRQDGQLMGPQPVWLHLLDLIECWCGEHLARRPRSFRLLRLGLESGAARS